MKSLRFLLAVASGVAILGVTANAAAQGRAGREARAASPRVMQVIDHWTGERRARAIPRDLVLDPRGLGYLRNPDGTFSPHGHGVPAAGLSPTPLGKPTSPGGGDSGDTTPPSISDMDPGARAEIGASHTFSATVTDASGVKSVSFVIEYPNGSTTQSFSANSGPGDTWSVNLQGFTSGEWRWWVIAKDAAGKGGNTGTSDPVAFTVNTSGSGGGAGGGSEGSGVVTNAMWTAGGAVQSAAGRLYFEMPANAKWKGPWVGYVCSGTVVDDATPDRSIILTAAHCVYDDVNKAFARNVLFIPNQAGTTGSGTDLNCDNDPLGCWVPEFGVVDRHWTQAVFPDNIPWDYAFYVVSDTGAHAGDPAAGEALEAAAGALPLSFVLPESDDGVPGETSPDFTHALGYSYSDDPNFMYCAEDMTTEGPDNWWLPSCDLSGGSSGGPWVQPMDIPNGAGPIISVNSWGYTNSPGMAGPRLDTSSASCVFSTAKGAWVSGEADGLAGIAEDCP